MKRALLVGGAGFAGCHMARLLEKEYLVTIADRKYDIRDKDKIQSLVKGIKPQIVINFAFLTTVRETFADPEATYQVGFQGMLNLLNALKLTGFNGRVLNISSSEVYGFPDEENLPLDESAPIKPMSPYSVAKISAEALCYQWSQTEGIDIVTARPFTHIGPGQSDRFALSSFSKQLAEMELGLREPVMHVGNLNSTRDISDVRDVVMAYDLLLKHGKNGEVYNVCSGHEVVVRALLEELIDIAGIPVRVEQDRSLVRGKEQQRILGSYAKLNKTTGWEPEIPLRKTLFDMIKCWKKELV
jgi:GDP-4-dehydro-6-deoxy-D-mannose reductase